MSTLYRALDNLSIGVKRGGVFCSDRLPSHVLQLFEGRGIIAPVNAPPLVELEEWAKRADVLRAAGIETLADVVVFSGIPAGVEADAWGTWQAEAEAALTIKCFGCRR